MHASIEAPGPGMRKGRRAASGPSRRGSPGSFGAMPTNPPLTLDATDHAIIAELQGDGRMSVAQLGRAVSAH